MAWTTSGSRTQAKIFMSAPQRGQRKRVDLEAAFQEFSPALTHGPHCRPVGAAIAVRRGAYASIERKAGDFATAGAAVQLGLDDDGTIAAVGIGLTAVAEAQFAATHAERMLIGARPGHVLFEDAGREAAAQSRPVADNHGPVEYKRAMAAAMVERALHRAAERAREA